MWSLDQSATPASNALRSIHIPHDDVIKWKHFPRYWPFVRGIHRSPVNSPHKGQWRGALMFSLICVCINGWVNNRGDRDLRRYRAHYDFTIMLKDPGNLQTSEMTAGLRKGHSAIGVVRVTMIFLGVSKVWSKRWVNGYRESSASFTTQHILATIFYLFSVSGCVELCFGLHNHYGIWNIDQSRWQWTYWQLFHIWCLFIMHLLGGNYLLCVCEGIMPRKHGFRKADNLRRY